MKNYCTSESGMRERGEDKVWKTILTKNGDYKKASDSQLGQQLLLKDALKILPKVKDWILIHSGTTYRNELKSYFLDSSTEDIDKMKVDERHENQFLLQKIVEVLLLLASVETISTKTKVKRHTKINIISRKALDNLDFDLTWRFVEVVIDSSSIFHIETENIYDEDGVPFTNKVYSSNLSEEIYSKLSQDAMTAFFPEPMTEPPLDWSWNEETGIVGGYRTYQYEMIRTKNGNPDYSKISANIFKVANYIQSTPWRINKKVLDQIELDLKEPNLEDFISEGYPNDDGCFFEKKSLDDSSFSEIEKALILEKRSIYHTQREIYYAEKKDFESTLGKYRAVLLSLGIARRYQNEDTLYFPHSFDFRGRIYPIPVGLSPQGSDAVKAMIEYKNGEVLNEEGAKWAWAYLASLYGDDKLSFEARVVRGQELLNADYKEADEPYQFLAHQLEMQEWVNDIDLPVRMRIHLDACNSGSQFTSALTGDLKGCFATNVLPTFLSDTEQARQDAYLLVADKSLHLTREKYKESSDKEEREALKLFENILIEDGRKICKTPVMVSNYGGTAGGRADIVSNKLRELKVDRKFMNRKVSYLLGGIIGDSIHGVLNGGKAFEKYIQKMNNLIAKDNKPVIWTTSDGFHVVHLKTKEMKPKQVKLTLPNARKPTYILKKVFSKDANPSKMRSAISPNYIHSLDSEFLRRVALRMKKACIIDSDFIHDSFGCRPNYVSIMLKTTKEEFQKMMEQKPLLKLDAELRDQITDDSKKTLKILEKNPVPINKDFDYSLPELKFSDWFFS